MAQTELTKRRGTRRISVVTVVGVSIGTAIVAHFGEFTVGVLGPAFERDLGAPPSQLGALVALMFVCSALGAIPSGFLADKIDARKLILVQVTLASLAFGSLAVALQAGHLFISVALVGFAISLNVPMTNRLVVDFVPREQQSTAVAWKSMGLQFSGLLTGLTFGLTEPFSPWRTTVIVVMVIMLLFGVVAHLLYRGAERLESNWEPHVRSGEADAGAGAGGVIHPAAGDAVAAPTATAAAAASATTAAAAQPPISRRQKIAEPIVWWMLPYSLLTIGAFTAVGTYMVFYATTEVGVSVAAAANASGIAAGVSLLARFAWVRWLTERNEVLMLFLTAFVSALAIVFLALTPALGPTGFWIAALTVGATVLAVAPVRQVIQLRNTHPRYIGRVSSLVGVTSAISLAGMPFLIAQFIDALGLQATWFIVVGLTMLGSSTMIIFAIVRAAGRRRQYV